MNKTLTTMPAHPIENRLAAAWPPEDWLEVTVLLALSGGPDSVALLRAMTALKSHGGGPGRLVAAHLNHRLRGAESDADEAFVADLCRRLGVACEIRRASPGALEVSRADGLEAAARAARYAFLGQAAARCGARYVATAHTADDQAETVLHRILRGTGIGGLAGMARVRPLPLPCAVEDDAVGRTCGQDARAPGAVTLIRPLLGFRRPKLAAYLDDLGQPCRHDASNDDLRFTRNRIRRELLPRLQQQFNPGVVDALLRLGALAGEVQSVVDSLVDHLFDRCVVIESANEALLQGRILSGQPGYLVRELLMAVWRRQAWPMQSMGSAQWETLREMAAARPGTSAERIAKQVFPGSVLAEAGPDGLRLTRVAA